ncbi:Hypothetical predicted protein, partial [Mytilus galloprovincialis]
AKALKLLVICKPFMFFPDELLVKEYTHIKIVCPLIPDKNENVSWIYGEEILAIQKNINPTLRWQKRISVVHNLLRTQFNLRFSNFTAEDQDVLDNFNFLPVSNVSRKTVNSWTTEFCTFELNSKQLNTHGGELLYNGTFKLTIPDKKASFGSLSHDLRIQREQFACFELNEDYCEKANKTIEMDVECKYLVVAVDTPWCNIRKFIESQLRQTSYRVKCSDCYKVAYEVSQLENIQRLLPHSDNDDDERVNDISSPPFVPVIPKAIFDLPTLPSVIPHQNTQLDNVEHSLSINSPDINLSNDNCEMDTPEETCIDSQENELNFSSDFISRTDRKRSLPKKFNDYVMY